MHSHHIMFVDDNSMNNSLTKAIIEIEELSIEPSFFLSPQKALDNLKAIKESEQDLPKCIFVDVNMPELSGFEFVELYEKMCPDEDVIIFFLSASVMERDYTKALTYKSVKGFYEKPFSVEIAKKVMDLI